MAATREFERSGRGSALVFDAIRMRLLEIGEAANGIPIEVRRTERSVPWGEIVGMRNWMAHRYFDTVEDCVWATVDHDLDPLLMALDSVEQRLLPMQGEPS